MSICSARARKAVRQLLRAPRVPLARRLDELREILDDGAAPTVATAYFDAFLVTDGAFFDASRPVLESPALDALRRVAGAFVSGNRLGDPEECVRLRPLELPQAAFWHTPVRIPGQLGTAFGFYGGPALLALWELGAARARYAPFPCPRAGTGHLGLAGGRASPIVPGPTAPAPLLHSLGGSSASTPLRSTGRGPSSPRALAQRRA
jgi:hypothetical protein